jgi:hypothetical protein
MQNMFFFLRDSNIYIGFYSLVLLKVFDLSEEAPDKVLHKIYCNFERLKSNGDTIAFEIQKSLRLIVSYLLVMFCIQEDFQLD